MNILLKTDVYKTGHLLQYPPKTTKVYSYMLARSDKEYPEMVFYGLQYYLMEYLSKPVRSADVDEFISVMDSILGPGSVPRKPFDDLVKRGYWPVEIKAVPEGTVVPVRNVLMTITNTHPDFYWAVGFLESLLLKVWAPSTVATNSFYLKKICHDWADKTCEGEHHHLPFQIHDFGHRGCSSEETAMICGSAHILNFLGSDTIPAVHFAKKYYGAKDPVGLSVGASEHSVMMSYGRENELDAFKAMLKLYPTGIVSIVSDTYNLWDVLTVFTKELRDEILNRDGKVVFRPDSSPLTPLEIICGDKTILDENSPERKGALELLWDEFSGTINEKGYKVLNPKVGLIYGDGIYPVMMGRILEEMAKMGFASSNIVFGVGGLLLQAFSRDTLGFTLKATYAEVDGEKRNLIKDPVTSKSKKSHTGLLALRKIDGAYKTFEGLTEEESDNSLLELVFKNGNYHHQTFNQIKRRINGDC